MRDQIVLAPNDDEQKHTEAQHTEPAKLTTDEYRRLLRQQYERMAEHQQIIEAEWQNRIAC